MILFRVMYLIMCLMTYLILVRVICYAGLTKVISSIVVRRRGRSFCLNVVVDKKLCYLFDDLFDHCERPIGRLASQKCYLFLL